MTAPAFSQPAVFQDDSDVRTLETEAADRAGLTRTTYRLRLQSASPAAEATRVYQRLELRDGEVFFLVERGPGEPRWNDFSTFYLRWSSLARPIEVVVGDLRPGFGQGLLFSRSSRNGAGVWRPRADHPRLGYRSSGENDAFRGLGVRGRAGLLSWALLGGRGQRDARVDETGTVTSLPSSGIHVTRVEQMGRNRLGVRVIRGTTARCCPRGVCRPGGPGPSFRSSSRPAPPGAERGGVPRPPNARGFGGSIAQTRAAESGGGDGCGRLVPDGHRDCSASESAAGACRRRVEAAPRWFCQSVRSHVEHQ